MNMDIFNKTVTVHCNTENGKIVLNIKGMVEECDSTCNEMHHK
jgi:hypothetical protein